jgi:hypothetical protein
MGKMQQISTSQISLEIYKVADQSKKYREDISM